MEAPKPNPQPRATWNQFMGAMRSAVGPTTTTRLSVSRPQREPRCKLRRWLVKVPELGTHDVNAHTKSDARSIMKGKLGLERLPVGTTVECLGDVVDAPAPEVTA